MRVTGRLISLFLVLVVAVPTATAATTGATQEPGLCILEVWTTDASGAHLSKLANHSIMIGLHVTAQTDCAGGFDLYVEQDFRGHFEPGARFDFTVTTQTQVMSFNGSNVTLTFAGLSFYPDGMLNEAVAAYEKGFAATPTGDYYSIGSFRVHEAWVALLSVIAAWVVSILLVDRLAAFRTSFTLIEEVVD